MNDLIKEILNKRKYLRNSGGISIHSCVIFTGSNLPENINNCIAFGYNKFKSNNLNEGTYHAEEMALNKLKKRDNKNKKKISILVLKSNKYCSHLTCSGPCSNCVKLLNNIGNKGYKLKNIYYSENNNKIIKVKLNDYTRQVKIKNYQTKFYNKEL